MKTLLVLRHAKSSWNDEGLSDHDRPLNKRGHRDAPRMGTLIQQEELVPDLMLTSTALRAKTTAEAVAETSGFAGQLRVLREMYLASAEDHIGLLASVDDRYHQVMIVAHNPGLEELVTLLTGTHNHLVTAALAVIELPLDEWSELQAGTAGTLRRLFIPKEDLPDL